MAEKQKKELFLRPGERLNGRLSGLAEEFEIESRQEIVLAVLKDFLGVWERIERQKRVLISEYEMEVQERLTVVFRDGERGDDAGEDTAFEEDLADVLDGLTKEGKGPKAGRKQ